MSLAVVVTAGCGAGDTSGATGSTTASPTASTTTSTTATQTPTPSPKPASPTTSRPPATPAAVTTLPPVPRAGAEPTVRFPVNEAASGTGANATVSAVPDSVWARMVGYSWNSGCPVGRSQLRYVRVNFWGFDGKRYRGSLVVNA